MYGTLDSKLKNNDFLGIEKEHCSVQKKNNSLQFFSVEKIKNRLLRIAYEYSFYNINIEKILKQLISCVYENISSKEIHKNCIMALCSLIEEDYSYGKIASKLTIEQQLADLFPDLKIKNKFIYETYYRASFFNAMEICLSEGIFNEKMRDFNFHELANYLNLERDLLFDYMGSFTLHERYFLKHNGKTIEMPQVFWMRIAMGLAQNEVDKNEKAKEFYDLLSNLYYIPSTPTLFSAGFKTAQLSSCYLNVVYDDLTDIFKLLGENAQLSKWAGGLGTSWTKIRGCGSLIKSIRSTSQGVIPYLKIADDVIGAITKVGIRRGGKCAYLETWHFDIEDFLDLRRNTGDHRRRTHDMNTAVWISDLFMKRVINQEEWILFSTNETPDLPDLYGKAFEDRYLEYEKMAKDGIIKQYKIISAQELWKKILIRLFETGHPWITFKDPSNIRSPQDHYGVIYSSNLCTEITLVTNKEETAVCNLGSLNIEKIIQDKKLNFELLKKSIKTAVRMLDNVIDLNFYPSENTKNSNFKHRPIGLGMMGLQDLLFQMDLSFEDPKTADFIDELMEFISFNVIEASCDLATERGAYQTFKGSKWDRGIFPLDTLKLLEEERLKEIIINRKSRLNWKELKEKVKKNGLRNSNMMAIAPTATISTIAGVFPSIEPLYKNLYVKSNVSGEFTIVNHYLIDDLKKIGLWDKDILDQIKYYDGSIQEIQEIPQEIKNKYKTAFEISQHQLLYLTALRGKWIDQSQSHNVFFNKTSGKELESLYMYAWNLGLKTTYYLRTLGASQIEKSTLDSKKFGFTQLRKTQCNLEEGCESCQ